MTSPAHSTKTTHTRAALVPRACRWFLKVLSLPREAALCRLRQGFLQGARTENESLRLHVLPASRRACREFGSDHEAEYGFLECCHATPGRAECPTTLLHAARCSELWVPYHPERTTRRRWYTCCSSSHDSRSAHRGSARADRRLRLLDGGRIGAWAHLALTIEAAWCRRRPGAPAGQRASRPGRPVR